MDVLRMIRKMCIKLAANTSTPISYFAECTINELAAWADALLEIRKEEKDIDG